MRTSYPWGIWTLGSLEVEKAEGQVERITEKMAERRKEES